MIASIVRRVIWSAILTAALVTVASCAMYVTAAPKFVSLVAEPFSLLLMPGLVAAVILSGPHDFIPTDVVYLASIFYFAFFYWALPRLVKAVKFQPPGSR